MNEKEDHNEDYYNKIFDLYKDKYRDFKTSFIVLLGFAVIFLFIILLPHFSLLFEKNYLSEEFIKTDNDLQELEKPWNEINQLYDRFVSEDNLYRTVEELIEFVGTLNVNSLNFSQIENVTQCIDNRRNECKIINKILITASSSNLTKSLQNLSTKNSDSINAPLLLTNLNTASKLLNVTLSSNIELIRSIPGKEELYKLLWNITQNKLEPSHVEPFLSKINNTRSTLDSHKQELIYYIKDIDERDKQVEERLSGVNTPIGNLPITLEEGISIVPLSLAIGSLISTFLMIETIKLRSKFHNFFREKLGIHYIEISNIAPLWIDPIKSKKDRITKSMIFFIPFIIFIISCILIGYQWEYLDNSKDNNLIPLVNHNQTQIQIFTFPGGKEVNQSISLGLYWISFGLFIYQIRKISSSLKSYNITNL